jgi:hypothetical protein
MKRLIFAVALITAIALAPSARAGDDPNWYTYGDNAQGTYAIKKGSCELFSMEDGSKGISCIDRAIMGGQIHFNRVATLAAYCKKGVGQLFNMDVEGKKVISTNDVVSKGGSIGAEEFDFLCLVIVQATSTGT